MLKINLKNKKYIISLYFKIKRYFETKSLFKYQNIKMAEYHRYEYLHFNIRKVQCFLRHNKFCRNSFKRSRTVPKKKSNC